MIFLSACNHGSGSLFCVFRREGPHVACAHLLPDAHVEAPTAGSVILAGVLLKFGGYGFCDFHYPCSRLHQLTLHHLYSGLSVIAIIYTSLVALAQEDMKNSLPIPQSRIWDCDNGNLRRQSTGN